MQAFAQTQNPPATGPQPERDLDFMGALKFVFTLERPWNTILLATVTLFIPVVGQIVLNGWHSEIMQRLARKHPRPIPDFNFSDLMHYLSRGVAAFAVQILASLPISIILGLLFGVGGVVGAILSAGLGASADEQSMVMVAVFGVVGLLTLLAAPLLGVIVSAAVTRAEMTENIGDSLSFRPLLAYLKRMWLPMLGATFAMSLIGMVGSIAGLMCCYFGVFPVAIVLGVAMVHLRHQIYQKHLARGGEPIAMKPAVALPSELAAQPAQYPYQR
jgi:hypothetical protein